MITSTANPKIKWVRTLQAHSRERRQAGVCIVEGVRLVEEALRIFFDNHYVVQVSTSPTEWVAAACQAAGRNLTASESAVFLPGRPLHPTCADAR